MLSEKNSGIKIDPKLRRHFLDNVIIYVPPHIQNNALYIFGNVKTPDPKANKKNEVFPNSQCNDAVILLP